MKNLVYRNKNFRKLSYFLKLRTTPDCIFVWVPKTAGTSLFEWLHREIGMLKLKHKIEFQSFPNVGATTFGHVQYQLLLDAGIVTKRFDQKAYKFAVTRNPYNRTVSLYNYLTKKKLYEHGFSNFLYDIQHERPAIGLFNSHGLSQANPQSDWLFDRSENLLVDQLFDISQLEDLAACLETRFKFQRNSEIGRSNVTTNGKLAHPLLSEKEEYVEIIQEVYRRDFELLGYSLELPPGM